MAWFSSYQSTETYSPPPKNSTIREAGRHYPFLLTLAGLVLTTSTSAALLDFVFKAQAADTLGKGEALVRFFGVFYTATSFLTFLVQTFLVRFVFQYGGLAASASALPATAAAGGLTALLIPGFGVFNSVRGIESWSEDRYSARPMSSFTPPWPPRTKERLNRSSMWA